MKHLLSVDKNQRHLAEGLNVKAQGIQIKLGYALFATSNASLRGLPVSVLPQDLAVKHLKHAPQRCHRGQATHKQTTTQA